MINMDLDMWGLTQGLHPRGERRQRGRDGVEDRSGGAFRICPGGDGQSPGSIWVPKMEMSYKGQISRTRGEGKEKSEKGTEKACGVLR